MLASVFSLLGGHRVAGHFLIIEMDGLVLEDLIILMALAEDDDDIILLGQFNRAEDGLAAVRDLLMVLRADGFLHALFDLAQDEVRVLGARVVRSRNDDIGKFCGQTAHDGAFRAVASSPS